MRPSKGRGGRGFNLFILGLCSDRMDLYKEEGESLRMKMVRIVTFVSTGLCKGEKGENEKGLNLKWRE